jgi:hypothetical protein
MGKVLEEGIGFVGTVRILSKINRLNEAITSWHASVEFTAAHTALRVSSEQSPRFDTIHFHSLVF